VRPTPVASSLRRGLLIGELVALAAIVAAAWWLGGAATTAWQARVHELGLEHVPAAALVDQLARRASWWFSLGVFVLATARALALRRAPDPLPAPALLPALSAACLLGLVLQHGTVEVVAGVVRLPTAIGFAQGFLLAAVAAAVVMLAPLDLEQVARKSQLAIALAICAVFLALAVAGTGPGGSGTRINLGPVQPIEVVKPLAVLFLAAFLGRRASKLRWQRRRWLGLRWPRLDLLLPALLVQGAIFAALFLVGDLGPVLLLAAIFLAMVYLVTRASGWVAAAAGLVAVFLLIIHTWPGLVDTGRVATRIQIWKDPWNNGLSHGHQVGEGLWAIAAGGLTGQGLGQANLPLPPAGKTDLVLAVMMEQLGLLSLWLYLALLAAISGTGLYVAARSRTAVRVLLAGGAALLLIVQWAVIFCGTFGLLPLTGIVAPYLSTGRSSMISFVVVAAMLARLATDGRVREASPELDELHASARWCARAVALVILVAGVVALRTAVIDRRDLSARGLRVTLGDGSKLTRYNPRILAIAAQIRRGSIADRNGQALASSASVTAPRSYPLGAAFGTLLGADPSRVLRPQWSLERLFDSRLGGSGPGNYRTYAALLELPRPQRASQIRRIDDDVGARSVTLSIDADLQRAVAEILSSGIGRSRVGAAAAVVMDVDSGQVLARAQVPDLDPADPSWQELLARRGEARSRFLGAYGGWADRTGVQGMFQAGSIAKLFTALAAARGGLVVTGAGCAARSEPRLPCIDRDSQGPRLMRPGWPRAIHDFHDDAPHGSIDLASALAVSCNIYFAQLGLALGADPLRELRAAGAEVGYIGAAFAPGEAGTRQLASTAFGQGAMVMNVMQAARLVAAIAGGGQYRRCPSSMEASAPCPATALIQDAAQLAPIIAGMRMVMTEGTGRRLVEPRGLRVYGKTGTADAGGFLGEAPYGIAPGQVAAPHSWFVGFAEPIDASPCATLTPARIAVAVVVPRGGAGATSAGPLAMKILEAQRRLSLTIPR
jgi:cell division protein FtsW (lipid II flippase)